MMPPNFVLRPPPHINYRQAARNKRWSPSEPELLIGQPQGPETNREHAPVHRLLQMSDEGKNRGVGRRKREEIKYSLRVSLE